MHRQLFVAALIAALPMFASGAGQPPAATEKPHPSSNAHANAVAGQAGATRIEACTTAANALIDNLDKGDYKAATTDFDATMQANLGTSKLGEVWKNIGTQAGKLEDRGVAQNAIYQGHSIITLPLHFQKMDLNAQVACDADGKIAGFFLRPASSAPAGSP